MKLPSLAAVAGCLVAACLGAVLVPSPSSATTPAGIIVEPGSNAGYVITPATLRSVSASWTVPTVTCTTPQSSVGIGILLGNRSTGHFVTLGVDVDCTASKPSYAPWLHVQGSRRAKIPAKVGPGDVVEASMKATPDGFSATLTNDTRGWSGLIRGPAGFLSNQAGMLVFRTRSGAVGGYHPLADFGTVQLTDGRINGKAVQGKLRRLDMRQQHSVAEVRTSKLQKPQGDFSMTYQL